eukprot:231109_1
MFALLLLAAYLTASSVSYSSKQCCIDPVEAFIMKEWFGSCSCQTLEQKWQRYSDWIEFNGGYINKYIIFDSVDSNILSNRGVFSNKSAVIPQQDILMQIPFSITFSQFLISKYIPNNKNAYNHSRIFKNESNSYFLPSQFPDFDEFLIKVYKHHDAFNGDYNLLSPSITVWMALGLSWLKQYTNELLPWISLLPSPYYLPFLFKDKKYLFKQTEVEIILNGLEYDFLMAYPYLNMLGLTEQSVRESYAELNSRIFQMDFSYFGGLERSPAVPCGADFFNSDSSVGSDFPFYDDLFGDYYYGKIDINTADHHMSNVIPMMIQYINKYASSKVKPVDFMSTYYFVRYPIYPKQQIFGSYGTVSNHPSHVSMALYGFMEDKIDENDHINLMLRNYNDDNYQYFSKLKKLPLRFTFGTNKLYFNKNNDLVRDIFLMYLPPKYMDSFTISSIINSFEWKYIVKVIGPLIKREIQLFCYDKVQYMYPNTILEDRKDVRLMKKQQKDILSKLNNNTIHKNKNEKLTLKSILNQIQQHMTITKYNIHEKKLYIKCASVDILYE